MSERTNIDLSDPTFALPEEEVLDVNESLTELPPPPAPGVYTARLELGARGAYQQTSREGRDFIAVHVLSRIEAPGTPTDKSVLHDDVNTVIFARRDGLRTCTLAIAASAIGIRGRRSTSELVKAFADALKGQPTVKITVGWRGYCRTCEKETLRGKNAFPEGEPTAKCPVCESEINAQAKVTRYSPAQQAQGVGN